MSKTTFRRPPATADDFVNQAATLTTAEPQATSSAGRQDAEKISVAPSQIAAKRTTVRLDAPSTQVTDLPNPRVMKQVNVDMPEPLYLELKELIDTMPKMSLRKFLTEAAIEKMDRVRRKV